MAIQKIIKILAFVVGIVGIFFLIRIMMIGDEAIEMDPSNQGVVSGYITVALIVLAIATILTLVFMLLNLFTDPSKLKRALISVGLFGLAVFIAYIMSTGVEQNLGDGKILTAGESRWVETGIRTFYILTIVAVGAMLYSGVKKMLMK